MLLTEYDEEKVKEQERKEGRREGLKEGLKEGAREIAARMIHANEPDEKIIAYTGLNKAEVREIRASRMAAR